jgi:hypothetical protein
MSLPGWRKLVLVIEEVHMNQGGVNTVSRRAALPVLGIAGLAGALLSPFTTEAKKKHKKKNRKKEDPENPENPEDPNALCVQQATQCTTFFNEACRGDLACLAKAARCCAPLGTCQFGTAFSCLVAP